MKFPLRLFILSNHNRCRSQIAAAFTSYYASDYIKVDSGGMKPETIHPLTLKVMDEIGIPLSVNYGKVFDLTSFLEADLILIMCEEESENCPVLPLGSKYQVWEIPDPYQRETLTLSNLRETRDEIRSYIIKLFTEYNIHIDRIKK